MLWDICVPIPGFLNKNKNPPIKKKKFLKKKKSNKKKNIKKLMEDTG